MQPEDPKTFTFVTCGNWDLKTMLPLQVNLSQLSCPPYLASWINLKEAFGLFYGIHRPGGMTDMLERLNIPLVGRHHSGIDDSRNIAEVLKKMLEDGYVATNTWAGPQLKINSLPGDKGKGKEKERERVPQFAKPRGNQNDPNLNISSYDASAFAKSHLVDIGVNFSHRSFNHTLPAILERAFQVIILFFLFFIIIIIKYIFYIYFVFFILLIMF